VAGFENTRAGARVGADRGIFARTLMETAAPLRAQALSLWRFRYAAAYLRAGLVVAYPTEGVYGLGCDPFNRPAVERIFHIKQRVAAKGLILIGAAMADFEALVTDPAPDLQRELDRTWPGAVTWILPTRPEAPRWLTGGRDSLAVRVSAHPLCRRLCRAFGGAIVSTSANVSGRPAACSALAVRRRLGRAVDLVLSGPLGGARGPSEIRDGRSGRVLRVG